MGWGIMGWGIMGWGIANREIGRRGGEMMHGTGSIHISIHTATHMSVHTLPVATFPSFRHATRFGIRLVLSKCVYICVPICI